MKVGDTVRINNKYSMPVHATMLRIRGRKVRVHDRLGGKYWVAAAMLTVLAGCTPHQSHLWWDGFGRTEYGWATTRESK